MPIPLTKETLACGYDYLCSTPPFNRWKMPPSSEIKFSVVKHKDRMADYQMVGGVHHIRVSSRWIGTRHEQTLSTIAHEMVHLKMEKDGMRASHGQKFQRLADRICKIHEFDRKTF